jgi:hypothetical protein
LAVSFDIASFSITTPHCIEATRLWPFHEERIKKKENKKKKKQIRSKCDGQSLEKRSEWISRRGEGGDLDMATSEQRQRGVKR